MPALFTRHVEPRPLSASIRAKAAATLFNMSCSGRDLSSFSSWSG
jgi:hypothetical protein